MMLILSIHEGSIYFHLFVSSLISFFSFVQFSEYRSFISLYFSCCIKWDFISWFLFLIFHCLCSKMPSISEYWLYILLFCQIYLLGWVVFLVESIEFPVYTIMSSANNNSFTSSFPIWMPFIPVSCLSAWLGLPILCWTEVVKVDILFLFLILVRKFLVFAHWVWCW